jgi:hypothetical protein
MSHSLLQSAATFEGNSEEFPNRELTATRSPWTIGKVDESCLCACSSLSISERPAAKDEDTATPAVRAPALTVLCCPPDTQNSCIRVRPVSILLVTPHSPTTIQLAYTCYKTGRLTSSTELKLLAYQNMERRAGLRVSHVL